MPLTQKAIHGLTIEQLLDAIVEEAAEIVYTASKARRYGLANIHPGKRDAPNNLTEICLENVQIGNLIRDLGARHGVNYADICETNRKLAEEQEANGVGFNSQRTQRR